MSGPPRRTRRRSSLQYSPDAAAKLVDSYLQYKTQSRDARIGTAEDAYFRAQNPDFVAQPYGDTSTLKTVAIIAVVGFGLYMMTRK